MSNSTTSNSTSIVVAPDFVQDTCQKNGHMTVFRDDKLISIGGYEVTSPHNDGNRVHLTSSYIRTFDFSKSVNLAQTTVADRSFQKLTLLPFSAPHIKWATLWNSADNKKLNLWGGDHEVSAIMIGVDGSGNPIMSNQTRGDISGSVMWQYDVTDNAWSSINLNQDPQPIVPLTRAAYAADEKGNVFVYGGIYEVGSYILNGVSWNPPVAINTYKNNLVSVDVSTSPPTVGNLTTVPAPFQAMERGAMHYISTIGQKGIMVTFGGGGTAQTNNDIQKVWIYDIATGKGYTQSTSAENENFPADRLEFCSVLVSSQDGSSHNIYVTGGWQWPNMANFAFNDVYVLSLPSFRWIYLGPAGVAKLGATCNRLGKYIVMYGGRRKSDLEGYNECRRNDLVQFYDMEQLSWTKQFDYAASKAAWNVPQQIYKVIGGDKSGGATSLAPKDGFSSADLKGLFQVKNSNSSNNGSSNTTSISTSTTTSSASKPNSGTNSGAIAGGVIGAFAFIGILVAVWFFLRRRRMKGLSQVPPEELPADTEYQGGIMSPGGQGEFGGSPQMGERTLPPQYTYVEGKSVVHTPNMQPVEAPTNVHAVEMDGTPRSEMPS